MTNADDVLIKQGTWWPDDYSGPPLVAMEDREAEQLGLKLGDQLQFDIAGNPLEATLAAIYAQRRFQTRYWLEGILSDGALENHITRYVGAAYLAPGQKRRCAKPHCRRCARGRNHPHRRGPR